MKQSIFQPFQNKFILLSIIVSTIWGCSINQNKQAKNYSVKTIKLQNLTIMHSDSTMFTDMFMYYCVYKGKPIMIWHEKKCDDCNSKFNKYTYNKIKVIPQSKFIDKGYWFQLGDFWYGGGTNGELLINPDVPLFKLID